MVRRWFFSLLALAVATGCGPTTTTTTTNKKGGSPTPLASSVAKPSFGHVLGLDGKPAEGVLVRGFIISDQGSSLTGFVRVPIVSTSGSGIISNNGGAYDLLVAPGHRGLRDTSASLPPADAAPTVLEARTDAEGAFTLKAPAGKALNIEAVRSEEQKAFKAEVPADATGLELRLDFTGQIHGKVTTPGAPTVTNHGGVDVYVPGTGYVAKTDDDGSYTIANVPVGTFRLNGAKAGLGSGKLAGIAVKAKATTEAPDLVLAVQAPVLNAVSPANAGPGATVTLTGDQFGASDGATFNVSFGGAQATKPERVDDHTIKAVVPASAGSGDVVVAVSDIPSNPRPFTVLKTLALPWAIHDLRVGATEAFAAIATDAAGKAVDGPVVAWKVDGAAASVDASGNVTAKAAGDATITASSGDLAGTLTLHVAAGPVVTTIAGSLPKGNPALTDGVGEQAQFVRPAGMGLAPNGDILLADGPAIRRITPRGLVSTFAGSAQPGQNLGKGKDAQFLTLFGLGCAADGTTFVTDASTMIRKVLADGTSQAFVGTAIPIGVGIPAPGPVADGKGADGKFAGPGPVALGPDGTLYVADFGRVRAVAPDGTVSTLAGAASPAAGTPQPAPLQGPDGPAATVQFNPLAGIAVLGQVVYVSDGDRLRAINLAAPDHAVATKLSGLPFGFNVVSDGVGKLYISTYAENAIRSWAPGEATPTVVIPGNSSSYADGQLATARLAGPGGMVADGKGHLYVADQLNGRLRRIDLGS